MGSCVGTSRQNKPLKTIINNKQLNITKNIENTENIKNKNFRKVNNKLAQNQKQFILKNLSIHYIFKNFNLKQKSNLIDKFFYFEMLRDQYIFKQNDEGQSFFIIKTGQILITINQKPSVILKTGDSFGQLALLYYQKRAGSAQVVSQCCSLFAINALNFKMAMKDSNIQSYKQIKNLIDKVEVFKQLTSKQKTSIIKYFVRISYQENQIIFQQSDKADFFYIIQEGSVIITIAGKAPIILKEGQSFGQSCFYNDQKRVGCARANQDKTILLIINKLDIIKVFGDKFLKIIYSNIQKWSLARCQLFQKYNAKQLNIINSYFSICKIEQQQQVLMKKNQHPSAVIICLKGKINDSPPGTIFCTKQYGKKDLLCQEDIIASANSVFSFLTYRKLTMLFKQLQYTRTIDCNIKSSSIFTSSFDHSLTNSNLNLSLTPKRQIIIQLNFQNLDVDRIIEETPYYKKYRITDKKLAYNAKVYDRHNIIIHNLQQKVVNEKLAFETLSNNKKYEGFPCFKKSYINYTSIIFFFEPYQCKTLVSKKSMNGKYQMNKNYLQFYAYSLIKILHHLNNANIIYRNLKPEYILINKSQEIMLDNFFYSKVLLQNKNFRTYTVIGTPYYAAPEVFEGKGYSFQADYWSLGIVLYQLAYNKFPFQLQAQQDPYIIHKKIVNSTIKYPNLVNDQFNQILNCLLQKNPLERVSPQNLKSLLKYPFFSNFCVRDFIKQNIEFTKPIIQKETKKKNFLSILDQNSHNIMFTMSNNKVDQVPILWQDYII